MVSNEEMESILKVVRSLEDSGLLLKGVTQTIKKKTRQRNCEFLDMSLGRLGTSLLGNIVAQKRSKRT